MLTIYLMCWILLLTEKNFLESPFIKKENRERKEDMWGYESLKIKADNLTHYINRKESALKIIINIDAFHKILVEKTLWRYKPGLNKNNKKIPILIVNWLRKKFSKILKNLSFANFLLFCSEINFKNSLIQNGL